MFQLTNKKAKKAHRIEVEAECMNKISKMNKEIRLKEESILDMVVRQKVYFEDYFAASYLKKLRELTNDELLELGLQGLQAAIAYIKELGMLVRNEEVSIYERVFGIMMYDLSDSIENLPKYIHAKPVELEKIQFEILLILQFIYAYEDYDNIQKDLLCVPFTRFKNAFPSEMLVVKQS